MEELKFFLTLNNKLVSVNDLYKTRIGYKCGHPYPIVYKNPKAVKLGNEMREQMRALELSPEQRLWLTNNKKFTLYLHAVFKTGMKSRDASNIIKLAEDQLVEYIKNDVGVEDYDDSLHIKVISEKSILPKAKHEFLGVCLSPYVQNVRFDQISKPEKIWINSDTYDLGLPPIPKRRKKAEIYKEIVKDKSEADTLIYIVNKSTVNSSTLIDIIQDLDLIILARRYTYAFIGIEEDCFSVPEKELLNQYISNAKEYYKYSGIKIEYIKDNSNITNWLNSI